MEWRQQTRVSCAEAFNEAQRWIEEVTGKSFGCSDFRPALENGVLLCDLINQLKPGIIRRVNRLSTPIAGLDNVTVFLKACEKLGLNVSQLFHPGDLQDLSTRATLRHDESNRRLKNVLITIYWLGRKAQLDAFYSGPQLNFKAFEGLLGLALSKALSVDGIDSLDSRGLRPSSEGCGSDAEAEQVFKMETMQPSTQQNKSYMPPPLRRKQGREENGRTCTSPFSRSKSLSDIPMVYPVHKVPDGNTICDLDQDMARECNQENKWKCSIAAKDSEAQWHEDLTKWKNRRRSTKSDLRRKSQDREHVINQMANGAVTKSDKNEAQSRWMKRDQRSPHSQNPAPRPYSTSPPSKSCSSDLWPHTRAVLTRGYATEAPLTPVTPLGPHSSAHTQGSAAGAMPASDGNSLGEDTHCASLASDGAGVTTPSLDFPFCSQTQVKAHDCHPPVQHISELTQPQNVVANQISTLITTIQPHVTTKSTNARHPTELLVDQKAPSFYSDAVDQASSHQNHKSQEESQSMSWEQSVEQRSGQQAADVNKYLLRAGSWSGSAGLPRGYRRSEGSSRLSAAITARPFVTKQSRMSSLPRLCNVDNNQGLLITSEKQETVPPTAKYSLKRQTASVHLKAQQQASAGQVKAQALLNGSEQKEVKRAALSSQPSLQTNGYNNQPYTHTQLLPQPYSTLQIHHNKSSGCSSKEISDLLKVDHSDMRVSLSLKPNSRPDFGFQTHWDSRGVRVKSIQPDSPAELCQLCVDDEVVAVNGVAVACMNYNLWKDKMTSSLQAGTLTMDIRRYGNKDWRTNEGSHHNQPSKSRMTINLTATAPVLIGCSDHHANSGACTDTAVRKMSRFKGQTDNVLPGKVMHGELADSHTAARSKGGSESAISDLQVPSLSPSSSSWSWDHEEDQRRQEKWQEEQERLLQEQYQQDQERLESEWQRAQQEAKGSTCEMTSSSESPASSQLHVNGFTSKIRGEEQSPDRDELKEAESKLQSKSRGEQHDNISEHTWPEDSCGFAQLSPAHRAKSLSTSALAGVYKQTRGDERKRKGQSVSNAEKDRQQILEEMKKRTHLLTDSSWIRQRSSSFYKEPIYVGAPMKRYESLDDLDSLRQCPLSAAAFTYPRPHSAAAGYCAPTRNASSRYSTGSVPSQRNTFDSSGSAWAATSISEEVRLESRFDSEMGSPAASSAISNPSPLVSPPLDQHAVLQITE